MRHLYMNPSSIIASFIIIKEDSDLSCIFESNTYIKKAISIRKDSVACGFYTLSS